MTLALTETAPEESTATGRCESFVSALSSGDVKTLKACMARDGAVITPDATTVHGRDEVALVLSLLAVSRPEISVEQVSAVEGSEVAVLRQLWWITVNSPEGGSVTQQTPCTMVLRRVDEEWKLAIAAPWGWPGEAPRRVGDVNGTSEREERAHAPS